MKLTKVCQLNHKTYEMEINCTPDQYELGMKMREQGVLTQNAFPTLTADEREFIMTGTPPHVWEEMFGAGETLKFAPHSALQQFRDEIDKRGA